MNSGVDEYKREAGGRAGSDVTSARREVCVHPGCAALRRRSLGSDVCLACCQECVNTRGRGAERLINWVNADAMHLSERKGLMLSGGECADLLVVNVDLFNGADCDTGMGDECADGMVWEGTGEKEFCFPHLYMGKVCADCIARMDGETEGAISAFHGTCYWLGLILLFVDGACWFGEAGWKQCTGMLRSCLTLCGAILSIVARHARGRGGANGQCKSWCRRSCCGLGNWDTRAMRICQCASACDHKQFSGKDGCAGRDCNENKRVRAGARWHAPRKRGPRRTAGVGVSHCHVASPWRPGHDGSFEGPVTLPAASHLLLVHRRDRRRIVAGRHLRGQLAWPHEGS